MYTSVVPGLGDNVVPPIFTLRPRVSLLFMLDSGIRLFPFTGHVSKDFLSMITSEELFQTFPLEKKLFESSMFLIRCIGRS